MIQGIILFIATVAIASYLVGIRRKKIAAHRQHLARTWVSEGDMASSESIYMTVALENTGVNLIGSLSSSVHDKLFGVYGDVGWFKTTLYVSELKDNKVTHVASAIVKLSGYSKVLWVSKNPSRLNMLPGKAVLWPHSDNSVSTHNHTLKQPQKQDNVSGKPISG